MTKRKLRERLSATEAPASPAVSNGRKLVQAIEAVLHEHRAEAIALLTGSVSAPASAAELTQFSEEMAHHAAEELTHSPEVRAILETISSRALKRSAGPRTRSLPAQATVGEIRRAVKAALLQELGGRPATTYNDFLNRTLYDMQSLLKTVERAHQLAPQGTAKAIIAGIHSDLFNQAAEIRKYVERLKNNSESDHPYR